MVTAVKLLYAQKWKTTETPIMDEWTVKMSELAEMTCMIKEGTTIIFKKD